MFRPCTVLFKTTGFYIATHPWISAAGLVKIGYSENLECRLESTPFTTCFTPEWRFHASLKCRSAKDALLLEQSVLFCLRECRIPRRELVRVTAAQALRVAEAVARSLHIDVTVRDHVNDPPCAQSRPADTGSSKRKSSHPPDGAGETAKVIERVVDTLRTVPVAELLRGPSTASDSPAPRGDDDDAEDELSFLDDLAAQADASPSWLSVDGEVYEPVTLRPYQLDAVQRLEAELRAKGKTICQMACRCGKTPVAYHLIQRLCWASSPRRESHGRVLYLVPGLTLLRQTARKFYGYGLPPNVSLLLIGSDSHPIVLDEAGEVTVIMTTDKQVIGRTLLGHPRLLVICTYHSSPLLAGFPVFDMTVFDECHRVCGSTAETAFNTILRLPSTGPRLFLTATPTYDTPIRMSDEALFGGIGYRYYLREGIDAGFVNPFSVRLVLTDSLDDLNPCLFEAMRRVDKMLVFCRNISHAESLVRQLNAARRPADVKPFSALVAHSRMSAAQIADALGQLVTGTRCILFNVRLFQEGVEIPDLNAVFFAAPRYSSRDIIQSICRPLNKTAQKPPSLVFLPAVYHRHVAADHPINLESFATLVPFTDALMDEDPTLFEYMIDPHKVNYDLRVVGVRSLRLTTEELKEFVLPAVRRGVRYSANQTDRLHRASRLPWKYVFGEMRRIVTDCHRYPKTNDAWVVGGTSLSMSLFYRYARKGYQQYLAGQQTYLQTYQIRDLESLPEWTRYGVHGPYPWKECMATLEAVLQKYGTPPLLDVHKGGYIGLDATPFERLSGCLMHVNQCDARTGLRLSPDKQSDLDRLAARYGLQWRKPRDPVTGFLKKGASSFITRLYDQFKALHEQGDGAPAAFKRYVQTHFPDYPTKHERMETAENLASGKVPPRHAPKQRRGAQRKTPEAGTKKVDKRGRLGEEAGRRASAVVPGGSAKRRGRPPGSRNARRASDADYAAHHERTVMCRICRQHVAVQDWELHLASTSHLRAQTETLAPSERPAAPPPQTRKSRPLSQEPLEWRL